jgi:hypothetical protein
MPQQNVCSAGEPPVASLAWTNCATAWSSGESDHRTELRQHLNDLRILVRTAMIPTAISYMLCR